MAQRKPFKFRTLDKMEIDQVDQTFDNLYKHKTEAYVFTDTQSITMSVPYQEIERGCAFISGVANSSTTTTVAFSKKYNKVVGVALTPIGSSFTTRITNITQSEMTVLVEATAALGSANYKFFWSLTGSLE